MHAGRVLGVTVLQTALAKQEDSLRRLQPQAAQQHGIPSAHTKQRQAYEISAESQIAACTLHFVFCTTQKFMSSKSLHKQALTRALTHRREKRAEVGGTPAAREAKALAKTPKKPRLSPGQTSLPVELWGLVLEQLVTNDSLWDLRGTVQELCNISRTCRDLHSAVQQQGWPQLSQLLGPCYLSHGCRYRGSLPANPDLLVTWPVSLSVTELQAACRSYYLPQSGVMHHPADLLLASAAPIVAKYCAADLLSLRKGR